MAISRYKEGMQAICFFVNSTELFGFHPHPCRNASENQRTLPRTKKVSTGHFFTRALRGPSFRVLPQSPPNKKDHPTGWSFLFGGDWGTRTLDLMRVKHAL